MSSSPLVAGPDWRSFSPVGQNNATDPPPRPWTSQQLGGEALPMARSHSGSKRNSTQFGSADPIGSRPASRSAAAGDISGYGGARSPIPGAVVNSSMGAIGTQRPNVRDLAAAASSAAARSRAASPTSPGQYQNEPSLMGLGTSYHAFRLANSSSPSFVSATSQPLAPSSEDHFSGQQAPNASDVQQRLTPVDTPRLVIEGFNFDSQGDRNATVSNDKRPEQRTNLGPGMERNDDLPALTRATDSYDITDVSSPLSASVSSNGGLQDFTSSKDSTSQTPTNGAIGVHPRRLQSHRSETGHCSIPNTSQSAKQLPPLISSPGPFLHLGAASSTASLPHMNTALLSPTAATSGTPGGSFSPFSSPPRLTRTASTSVGPAGRSNVPPRFAPHSQTSMDFGQPSSTGGDELTSSSELVGLGSSAPPSQLDNQLQASPFLQDILDRLIRVELGLKDVNRHISGLSRNVSLLLDKTKGLPGNAHVQNQGGAPANSPGTQQMLQQASRGAASGTQQASDEVRAMGAQIAALSASVSHLLGGANQNGIVPAPANAMPPSQQLAGLGLGTPQMGFAGGVGEGMNSVTTQQLGTFPGTPAHLGGGPGRGQPFELSRGFSADRGSKISPRPGASPGPNNRRWSSMIPDAVPGTPNVSTMAPNGAMNPPDPSVIVTKWDHLNLHADLLRSILKYGLGPPNKIQQRALPFLLRGSDIIAQAPPTQERIASYVIPALQLVLNVQRGEPAPPGGGVRGPIAIIMSATVDQATQAQRMALGLGSGLGIRVHIAAAGSIDVSQEATAVIQSQAQIIVGTPQKMNDLFTFLANRATGALNLADVRIVILDEVDQLIARNLADYISTLLRILPPPRMIVPQNSGDAKSPGLSPGLPPMGGSTFSPFEANAVSTVTTTDRQTAIFSNTVPQDVLNFAQSIHLRESVRVLVRREGGVTGGGGVGTGAGGNASSNPAPSSSFTAMPASASGGSLAGGLGGYASSSQAGGSPYKEAAHSGAPPNALGASPANSNSNPLADPLLSSLRGMRQYYLYVAVSTGAGRASSPNHVAMGSALSHAVEMKLDVITDLLEDIDFGQAVIYTSNTSTHEAVVYKLASKGIEALSLHKDMANITRQQVLAKYRSANGASAFQNASNYVVGGPGDTPNMKSNRKALVVHDVAINPREVHQVPLIVFYDLPRSVDEYKEKLACAAAGGMGRPSVCVNVVTGSGGPRGDIEMLRTLECHLGCKMAELPMNPSQILNF